MIRLIFEFFGGVIIVFAVGWITGHLLRLDKIYAEMPCEKNKTQKT
jgi:hypothetical protein